MENKSGRAFNVILFTTAFLLFATVLAWFVFAANPSLTSIVTKDSNNDGTIDQLVVTFGSDLDNSGTFDGTGFTVGSGCTAITGGSETGAGVITLDVTCTASNTALLPTLAYNNNTGNLFEDAGTQVADYINSFGATPATDGAGPAILSARTTDANTITVTFSESIDRTQLVVGDFTITDDGSDDLGDTTVTAVQSSGSGSTATIDITGPVVDPLAGSNTVQFSGAGVVLDSDTNGNTQTSTIAITDGFAPTATDAPTAADGPTINSAEYNGGIIVNVPFGTSSIVAGDTLELLLGGSSWSTPLTRVVDASDISDGNRTFLITSGQGWGSSGAKSITARVTDAANNAGTASGALALTLDISAPAFTAAAPSASSYINNTATTVSYTLNETLGAASINITRTSGTADGSSPHECTISGANLNSGAHTVDLATDCGGAITLVDGAVYTFEFGGNDAAGNSATQITRTSVTYDTTRPAVSITDDEAGVANIAGADVQFTFTFDEPVTGFTAGDIDVVGGSKGSLISESTTVYKMNITPTASSTTTITVDVSDGKATDLAGNGNTAATQATQTVDTLAPTVAITDDEAGVANIAGGDVQFTFTFSQAVTGFAAGDIDVVGGSKGSLISESATVYTMNITPTASSTTTITVDVNADVASDANSNGNEAATQATQAVDTLAPTVAITDDEAGIANIPGGDVQFTFTFSQAVTGFTAGDIDVVGGSKGSLISESTTVYKMNITPTASSTTTITVDVNAGVAVDANSNDNEAATQATQTVDTLAPTVAITDDEAGVANIAGGDVEYTFTFSQAVTGFTAGDVDVVGGSKGSLISESTTVYKMNITPTASSTTTLTVDVASDKAIDANSNGNEAATQSTQTVDTLAPTVAITDDEAGVANIAGGDVQFTFTFSQAVTGFVAGDIDVVGGSKGSLISESTTVYKMNITPTASSTTTITVDVNAGVAVDANSNGNEAATQATQSVDTLAPTVAITDDEAGIANIPGGDVQFTFTFSQAVTGFAAGDIDVVGGSKGSLISESTTVYKMNITPTASSTTTITVDVNAGVAVDANSNGNEAATQSTQTVDTLAPTVAITDDEAGVANIAGGDVQFTFTFSQAVTGFAAGDIDVVGGSKGSLISESTTVYKMNITPTASSTTTITVDVNAGVAVDANSNDNEAATQATQSVDTLAPTVAITDDEAGTATVSGGDVQYTFTFSEAVTGFAAGDIDVTGGSKGSLIAESATVYKMNITPTASSTTDITVDINAAVAIDANSNDNEAATQSVQAVDTTAPSLSISDDETGVANIAGGDVEYTFTFTEAVTGFTAGDIDVVGGTKGSLIEMNASLYKMNITPDASSTTTITVDVDADSAQNAGLNGNVAATQSTQQVDTLAPTVAITDDEAGVANIAGGAVQYTFTFSEAVTGFAAGDIDVVGGTKGSLINESSTVYKMNITPTSNSTTTITVDVNAGVAADTNANDNEAATQSTQTVDTLAPTLSISDDEVGVANIPGADVEYTFTFSQAVTGFTAGDIDVVGGSKGSLISESATVYKMNITPTASSTTNMTVDVNADVAVDANSNGNIAASQVTQAVDTLAPTVTITDDEAGVANIAGGDVQFTFTFSQAVTGFAAGDIDVVGGSKGSLISESTTVYKMNITPTASSTTTLTVDVNADVASDANSNGNEAATQATQSVDTLRPTVAITDDEAGTATSAGGDVQFTFTFSEAVTGFAAADIDVVGGTKGTLVNESTTVYKMNITPTASSTTTITVDVNASTVVDANSNPNTAATQATQAVNTLTQVVTITSPTSKSYNTSFAIVARITNVTGVETNWTLYRFVNTTNYTNATEWMNLTYNHSAGTYVYFNLTWNISALINGNYTLVVNSTDLSGDNVSSNMTVIFDTEDPVIDTFTCSDVDEDDDADCTCDATDNSEAFGGILNTTITTDSTATSGAKDATCVATDAAGNSINATATFDVNKASSGGGGGGGGSGATTTTTTSGTDVSDEDKQILESLDVNLEDVQSVTKLAVVTPPAIAATTLEKIQEKLATLDVPVQAAINTLLTKNNIAAAQVETKTTVYRVTNKDGTKSTFTQVSHEVTVTVPKGATKVQVVEIIPKSVATSASQLSGNFTVLEDDPVIAFNVLVKDLKGGKATVSYNVEGDVSKNITQSSTMVVAPKPTAATPTTATKSPTTTTQPTNSTNTTQQEKPVDYQPDSSGPNMIAMWVMVALIVLIAGGWWFIRIKKKPGSGDDLYMFSEY